LLLLHLSSFPPRRSSDLLVYTPLEFRCFGRLIRSGYSSRRNAKPVPGIDRRYRQGQVRQFFLRELLSCFFVDFIRRVALPDLCRSEEHTSELQSRVDVVC